MRPDKLYLMDILQAADDIALLVSGQTQDTFLNSMPHRRATLQAILEIGEAISRVSEDLKKRYPDVSWRDAIAMRNFVIHEYFSVDWDIVWNTAINDIPKLKNTIEEILKREFDKEYHKL